MPYRLAEKRCSNFKTCGASHDSVTGVSYVNTELWKQIGLGQHKLLMGDCEAVRQHVRKIVDLMAIPLIQGTLRYAYKVGVQGLGDKEKGEGAIFAAAIVPRVHYCNAADATTIMKNMKIGAATTSFSDVKRAFENNYACMNITCEEVGGLWFLAANKYYDGAKPCPSSVPAVVVTRDVVSEEEVVPAWAIAVIAILGVLVIMVAVGLVILLMRKPARNVGMGGGVVVGRPADDRPADDRPADSSSGKGVSA